jgi:hypothetical protein
MAISTGKIGMWLVLKQGPPKLHGFPAEITILWDHPAFSDQIIIMLVDVGWISDDIINHQNLIAHRA